MAWTEITEKIIGIIETFLKNLNETIKHLFFFSFRGEGGVGVVEEGWLVKWWREGQRRDD